MAMTMYLPGLRAVANQFVDAAIQASWHHGRDREKLITELRGLRAVLRDLGNISEAATMRRFSFGLLYDSIGWTPEADWTLESLEALKRALEIVWMDQVSKDDFVAVRDLLVDGGISTAPGASRA